MVTFQKIQIRRQVLLPIGLAMVIVIAIISATVYLHQNGHVSKENRERLLEVEQLFPHLLKEQTKMIEAHLDALQRDSALRRAWQTRDRDSLLEKAKPFFKEIKNKYGITHYYFIEPDKTCFLRVHKPEMNGDIIDRFTLAEARRSGKTAHGLELGPMGTLTFRVVRPWRIDGKIVGYLELGREIAANIPEIEKILGVELFIAIEKENLSPSQWQKGASFLERAIAWDSFEHVVIINKNRGDIPPQLVKFIDSPHEEHRGKFFRATINGRQYGGGQVPMHQADGREIGGIFVLHNIDKEINLLHKLMQMMLLIAVGTGTVLGFGFYLHIRKMERCLAIYHNELHEEVESHKKTAVELRQYKDNLEEMVKAQTAALRGLNHKLRHEVTTRQEAEAEAVKESSRWQRTFAAMGDIVTIHDAEMHIIKANQATADVLGVESSELIGSHCYQLFRGQSTPCDGCPEALAKHDYSLHTAEITHPNLGKTFLVSASPIINEQGEFEGVVHVAKDITKLKQLEAQYQQAQKMEAIGTLSGGVAHDFNNILTGIIGFAELALMDLDHDSPLKEGLKTIVKLGRRGADLTRQLLAFSRRQALDVRTCNLNNIIEDITKMIRRLIGEDISFAYSAGHDLANIDADSGQIGQVIMNLAINARDAMPCGGSIIVETKNVCLDENYAGQHMEIRPGDYVMLAISDSGAGMDKETRERIFEPFFTTKAEGRGIGLGLATVYGIVQQHHGSIFVYSEPGQGTTFKVYLPATTAPIKAILEQPQKTEELRGSETILVVEDEPDLLVATRQILEKFDYSVLTAKDPEEAETVFAEHENIDLLLTDLIMPKRNGKELFKSLEKKRSDLKVIFMSGYTDMVIKQRGIQDLQGPFLQKPFSISKLTILVRNVLDQ